MVLENLMTINYNENAMTEASILDGFTMGDIQGMLDENPSLRGYMQGYFAEWALRKQIENIPGVKSVEKIPDQDTTKGDLKVVYKDVVITIESKSIHTNTVKYDILTQSWEGAAMMKNTDKRTLLIEGEGEVSTSKLLKGQFDILAVCCFPISGKWDFMFVENRFLPTSEESDRLLKIRLNINPNTTPGLTDNLVKLLEKTLRIKSRAQYPELLAA
jgi:hypothetical protein